MSCLRRDLRNVDTTIHRNSGCDENENELLLRVQLVKPCSCHRRRDNDDCCDDFEECCE